jgi:DNA-binding protein Fis
MKWHELRRVSQERAAKIADRLGINRNTLRKKLEEYGLERP